MVMMPVLVGCGDGEPGSGERDIIVVKCFQLNQVRKSRIDYHLAQVLLKLRKGIQHAADEHVTRQAAHKIEVDMIHHEI